MSATFQSIFGYVMRIPAGTLDADRPVSVWRAEMTRNNLAHLLDEYCQTRINWSSTGTEDYYVDKSNDRRIWAQEFPHTWLREDRPVNLDLVVGAATTGASPPTTLSLRARVVPARFALGDSAADALALIDTTVTLTSATPADVIDLQTDFDANGIPSGLGSNVWATIVVSEGAADQCAVALMRLELMLDEVTAHASPVHSVTRVYLREFAG